MTKCVFITGAAGFIGFHLAKKLCELGHKVIGYDNFNSYYDPKLKQQRALELAKSGIHVIQGELTDMSNLLNSIEEHHTTDLIHLAAQAGVRYSLTDPRTYLKSNMDGFLNVLEACRIHPTIKLIYASSSSVYGLNKKQPFSVDDRTDHQASLYGVTKKANELMAQTYHHLFNFTAVGLRFFTVYGPWGRPDMAYFSFTRDILAQKPIELFNQGKMQRDFTYIDDIVDGIIGAIEKGQGAEIYNLGHHKPNELLHLIALIEKELGIKAQKILMPMQMGDVLSTYADITSSQEKLGFHPKTTLEEGIPRFIQWYKDYYKT